MILRFGIMCRGFEFEYWEAEIIRRLLALPDVEPALLILEKPQPAAPPSPALKRLRTLFTSPLALWALYTRYFVDGRVPARRPVNLSSELGAVPGMTCDVVRKGKFSEYFRDEDVAAIRSHNLDFILRFGFNIIRGEVLRSARYGVWSFHHDDILAYRGGPPCFWEVFDGNPETGITLQRLTDKLDGGVVLKRAHFPTRRTYAENIQTGLLFGAGWPAEVCLGIRNGDTAALEAEAVKTDAPIYYRPTNRQMFRFALRRRKLGR